MHAIVPPPSLFAPLTLPNKAVVPNRIAKAAMEENMADSGQLPGENLRQLYANGARGGAGLILPGNWMTESGGPNRTRRCGARRAPADRTVQGLGAGGDAG